MKLNHPVYLFAFCLLACSVPGLIIQAGSSGLITPAALAGTPPAVKTITAPAGTPVFSPVQAEVLPVITLNNVESLGKKNSYKVENISRLIWQPDSKTLAVVDQRDITLYEATDFKKTASYRIPENTSLLDYDPVSHLMTLTTDRLTLDIRPVDGKDVQSITPAGGFGSAAFETGGKRVWVSSMDEIKAIAYDTTTGKQVTSCAGFETAAPVYSASPSPSGKWLVWIARATIQLNHLAGCEKVSRIGHQDFISAHAFSSGDTILAVSAGGERDGIFQPLLYLYDPATGNQKNMIPLEESPAMDLSFSPDSTVIASAGSGLSLWDVATGNEVKSLAEPGQRFTAVAFSPDGRLLAAADEETLHIYAISR
jgi:WD40 repeat protein